MHYCRISGIGYYLPEKTLTNHDLEKMVDTSDEWIKQRTGIQKRHIANKDELPSDIGLKASLKALEQSKLKVEDLDLIIVATVYPDQIMPNTACELQRKLNKSCLKTQSLDLPLSGKNLHKPHPVQNQFGLNTPALDISSACSGFIYAFSIGSQYIQTGMFKNVLVVGAETLHRVTDYQDRSTCILFGDGAGAFVLSKTKNKEEGCVFHQELKTYGNLGHLLRISSPRTKNTLQNESETLEAGETRPEGSAPRPGVLSFMNRLTRLGTKAQPIAKGHTLCPPRHGGYIQMEGQKVFKHAVQIMCSAYQKTLKDTGRESKDIDWIVPHQANERILKKFCEVTGFPEQKVILDIKDTGNTSSASIPISFVRAVEQGKIQRGQNILMLAVGGGLSSGSLLVRF